MVNKTISKWKKLQTASWALFTEKGIFHDEKQLSSLEKFAHFWILSGKSFIRNRCLVRSSALAYTTLLAIVPLLAVVLSVTTSLVKDKGEQPIENMINTFVARVAPQLGLIPKNGETSAASGDKIKEVAKKITESIKNVRSGTLGVTGIIALVFVGISLLSTIEETLNDIWGVTRGRSWFNRVVQYWAAITLGPLLLIVVLGLNSLSYLEKLPFLEAPIEVLKAAPVFSGIVLPFIILMVLFALFYQLMPATKIHWKAALIGGVVAALLWHLNGRLNVIYVSQVVRNSQIYGSLGAFPVFLIGLYFSWVILLFGAQVSYAFQNRQAYFQEKQAESVNQRGREFVALRLMTFIAQGFSQGAPPPTALQIAEALSVPSRLIAKLLEPLLATHLLLEIHGEEKAYAPARPLSKISYQNILDALRAGQGQELATTDEPLRETVRREFEKIQDAEKATASAMTLEKMAQSK